MMTFLLVVRHLHALDSHRCTKGFSLSRLAPSSILSKYSAMWDNCTISCIWSIIMKVKREQPLLKGKGLCVAGSCSWGWVFSFPLSRHAPTCNSGMLQRYTATLFSTWAPSGSSQPLFLKTALPKSAFPWAPAHAAETLFILQSLVLQIQKSLSSKYGFSSKEIASWANAGLCFKQNQDFRQYVAKTLPIWTRRATYGNNLSYNL